MSRLPRLHRVEFCNSKRGQPCNRNASRRSPRERLIAPSLLLAEVRRVLCDCVPSHSRRQAVTIAETEYGMQAKTWGPGGHELIRRFTRRRNCKPVVPDQNRLREEGPAITFADASIAAAAHNASDFRAVKLFRTFACIPHSPITAQYGDRRRIFALFANIRCLSPHCPTHTPHKHNWHPPSAPFVLTPDEPPSSSPSRRVLQFQARVSPATEMPHDEARECALLLPVSCSPRSAGKPTASSVIVYQAILAGRPLRSLKPSTACKRRPGAPADTS